MAFLLPILAAFGAGRILARALHVHLGPSLLLAAGTPLLSLLLFLAIALRIARPAVFLPLCVVLALSALWPLQKPTLRVPWLAALAFVPIAAYYAVHALTPEIQPDAAGYHTGVVADWLRNARFPAVPGFYDILPLGLETLFLPAFALGRHTAAKLVHFTFFLACIPLILRIARQLDIGDARAWAAALLFFSAPVAAVSGTSAYNDAAFVFFHLAAFTFLLDSSSATHAALAGLAAGFCYAIKLPGLVVPVAGAAFLLVRRRPAHAALFSAAALVSIAPWMLRALFATGNPLAPLANSVFPNGAFHASTDQALSLYFREYGGIGWAAIPRSLAIGGRSLQGLFGPALFLLPLALLSLRSRAGHPIRAGHWLLSSALVAALPWFANHGARFLLPAWPFFALAICLAVPARAAVVIAALQIVACSPFALDRYAETHSWRLRGFPLSAALGIEPEQKYLARVFWEHSLVRAVNANAKPGEKILDLLGLPSGYLQTLPLGPLPSRDYVQMLETLRSVSTANPDRIDELRCTFPMRFLRAVRVRLERPTGFHWSVSDIAVRRHGAYLRPLSLWSANAWPEPIDAPLAADGALASRWSTRSTAQAGAFVDLVFDRPVPLDGVSAFIPYLQDPASVSVYGLTVDRTWIRLSDDAEFRHRPSLPERASAGALLKSRGIRWIVAPTTGPGLGPLGAALLMTPAAYGLHLTAKIDNTALFQVR